MNPANPQVFLCSELPGFLLDLNHPSGLRPDRRGRERFVDKEHSVRRMDVQVSIGKFVYLLASFPCLPMSRDEQQCSF